MSPRQIVERAMQKKLDGIGIADHNTMRQFETVKELGEEKGLKVFCGVEVTTREEAHCLAFFDTFEEQKIFQDYLDQNLPDIMNHPDKFGYQVWVNRHEEILGEENRLLISALNKSVDEIANKVHSLNGLFIAAHIDRPSYSLISQLGFIDHHLQLDGIEISIVCNINNLLNNHPYLSNYSIFSSSDAHYPEIIGTSPSILEAENLSFKELTLALRGEGGRKIYPEHIQLRANT
jgi:PHP family Zn ribbon phosphoesterase